MFLDKAEFSRVILLSGIENLGYDWKLPNPAIMKPFEMWTGKQAISFILRRCPGFQTITAYVCEKQWSHPVGILHTCNELLNSSSRDMKVIFLLHIFVKMMAMFTYVMGSCYVDNLGKLRWEVVRNTLYFIYFQEKVFGVLVVRQQIILFQEVIMLQHMQCV